MEARPRVEHPRSPFGVPRGRALPDRHVGSHLRPAALQEVPTARSQLPIRAVTPTSLTMPRVSLRAQARQPLHGGLRGVRACR